MRIDRLYGAPHALLVFDPFSLSAPMLPAQLQMIPVGSGPVALRPTAGMAPEPAAGMIRSPLSDAPESGFDALLLVLLGMTANPVAPSAIEVPAAPAGQTLPGSPAGQLTDAPTDVRESGLIATVQSMHSRQASRQAALQFPLPHRPQSIPQISPVAAQPVGVDVKQTQLLTAVATVDAKALPDIPAETPPDTIDAASITAINANPAIIANPASGQAQAAAPSIPVVPAPNAIPQVSPVVDAGPPHVVVSSDTAPQSIPAALRIQPDEALDASNRSTPGAALPQAPNAEQAGDASTVAVAQSASLPAPADATEITASNGLRIDAPSTTAHTGFIAAAQLRQPASEPTPQPGSDESLDAPLAGELEIVSAAADGAIDSHVSHGRAEELQFQRRGATAEPSAVLTPNLELPATEASSDNLPHLPAGDDAVSPAESAVVPHTVAQSPTAWSTPPVESAASAELPKPLSDAGSPPSVSRQVSDAIVAWRSVAAEQGTARFSAWLSPPELGQVWIELTRSSRGISARLSAVEEGVQSILELQAPQLRQSLSDSGVTLADLDVSSGFGQQSQDASGKSESPAFHFEHESMLATQTPAVAPRHQGTINIRA